MNRLKKFRTNSLTYNMEEMTEESLRLSLKLLVYFSEQFLFFYDVFFNPSFIIFVKKNRGRTELWVVMF